MLCGLPIDDVDDGDSLGGDFELSENHRFFSMIKKHDSFAHECAPEMRAHDSHILLAPTGFNFGISVIPPKIPPNFGICAFIFVGGGGLLGAFKFVELLLLLLLLFEFAIRPAMAGPLLSTVVVFFNFAPF